MLGHSVSETQFLVPCHLSHLIFLLPELNLDEKDNNRLTLFERTATENYLNISQKLAKEELNSKVSDTAER